MKHLVITINSRCVGCNKCSRACPVGPANVVHHDYPERFRVSIDQGKCLACGRCIEVCTQDARDYRDDLIQFLRDLSAGKRIQVIATPSMRANFPEYRRVYRWLRSAGVEVIHDGSLGYLLHCWANAAYIRRFRPYSAIVTHCPVITEYIRIYRQELLPRLTPVPIPQVLQALHLKESLPEDTAIAALTPCIAAPREFQETNVITYNITFRKLKAHLERKGIELPPDEGEEPASSGGSVPIPPDLATGLSRLLGPDIRVDGVRSEVALRLLDDYATSDVDLVPPVLALSYCNCGCTLGTASCQDVSFFRTASFLYQERREEAAREEELSSILRTFDEELELERFLQPRSPKGLVNDYVPEEDLNAALRLLGKSPDGARQFDCGFCGCQTCREMARKVALHTNIPLNCVTMMRQTTEDSNRKITAYIELIRNVSENLLNRAADDATEGVDQALLALCYAMDGFSASLWKNTYDSEERPSCRRVASFPALHLNNDFNVVTLDDPPGWLETLVEGNSIMRSKSAMNLSEQQKFLGRNVNFLVLAPVIAQGDFWGFLSLFRQDEAPLTDQDLSVISVCSNLLASYLINLDLMGTSLAKEGAPAA
ncbi:MAG: 4Fe-4S dicluster domain-containing protein [Deltaproteobacteria bacterium]|jgi:Na+-translocating ferredoxin:NAD+ oxidoreductase RNF subunit RnfB|nr:4Fe-4S dicluster domain-containing protein [Deltaproteobacteria bacterium]